MDYYRNLLYCSVLPLALTILSCAAVADGSKDCLGVLEKAPKNTTDITDRSRELLTYGHVICSSEWKYLSDVQSSNQSLSLSLVNYIGLTSNDSSASQKFQQWKKDNCDKEQLKKEIYNDLLLKQSFVSDLVYKAYETCVSQRASSNAGSCAFIPTASSKDGFLFVFFAPNDDKTETALGNQITLKNGKWENGTNVLPKSTKIQLRDNYFPITREDVTKGDFFRVSFGKYPGNCAVEVPPWPTFNATLSISAYYTQAAQGRSANQPVQWNATVGMGPSWICLSEEQARKTLNWNEKEPIDFRISNPQFDVKTDVFGQPIPVRIIYNHIDKTCAYLGPESPGAGSLNFQVDGTRKKSFGKFTKNAWSRGKPIMFQIDDWTLPSDAVPGSKMSFEYDIQISEQRGDKASPVVGLTNDNPATAGYRSSIDSKGVVTLVYQ